MPPSKQARSRQARQKERLAVAAARRQQSQRRRRRAGAAVAALVVIAVVLSAFALGATGGNNKTTATTTPATTPQPVSAKGKPCVAVKGPLPKGAPKVPVKVGPPPTQLVKQDLKTGSGAEVKAGATITVNYVGVACSTGKVFDSSWTSGKPAQFPLSGVIPGWTNGIPGMRVGGRRLLGIPSEQAYKSEARGALIAPDEALWFVVDVVAAK